MLVDSFILSGDVLEVMQFNALENKDGCKMCRGGKINKSNEKQIVRNLTHSRRHYARLVNANFAGYGISLGLDYDDEFLPLTFEDGIKQVQLYIDRLRKYLKRRHQPKLKYIAVTEQMSSENNRLHHHLVISRVPYDVLKNLWKLGGVTFEEMDRNKDYIDLANYITKEKNKERKFKKKWMQSKNLDKPSFELHPAKRAGEVKLPRGFKELERELIATEYGATLYIRAIRAHREKKSEKYSRCKKGGGNC